MNLSIRVKTEFGTRTIVTSGHEPQFAHAIKQALDRLANQAMEEHAIYAEVTEEGASIPMKEHMRRLRLAAVRDAAKAEKAAEKDSNVESLATARSKKAAKK